MQRAELNNKKLNNKNIANNIFHVVEPSFEEWANVGKAVSSVSALG